MGAGVGAAVAEGTWSVVLVVMAAAAGLAALALLFRDAFWQSGEQDENRFRLSRSEDARKRGASAHAKAVRRVVDSAVRAPRAKQAAHAAETVLLEAMRRFLSSARREPIDMLVLDEQPGAEHADIVHKAGRHDSYILDDPLRRQEWIDGLEPAKHHRAPLAGCGSSLSLLATSDQGLDAFDRAELDAAANSFGTVVALHRMTSASGALDAASDA
ncbi:MAG: hypothetical protein JW940_21655 [Polyangiaceae bacterium]|nr:hypothetical protein [Polyangiaceae bacterium]